MADDDVRDLLRSSAARPSDAVPMGSIVRRARRRRLRRRAITAVVPLLIVAAGVAAGVTALPGDRVELAPADESATTEPTPTPVPTPGTEPSPEPTDEPEPAPDPDDDPEEGNDGTQVAVYYARFLDSGVWVEPELVTIDSTTVGVARAAMEALVGTPPRDPGLMTLSGEDAEVRDVNIDGDVLIVDFADLVGPQGLGAAGEAALLQQIAHTGAQFPGIRAVRLLVDGQAPDSLAGHVELTEAAEPSPFALSPITFTSHRHGEAVEVGEVTVGGQACTFEATVELTLTAPDGSVAEETFTTATSGCPERGTWEHTVTLDRPGTWTITATEPDPSGGEGRQPFEVSIELEAS